MKNMMKRSLSLLLVLTLFVGLLSGLTFHADAATVNYQYSGSYVYNWGTREEEATFLSPMAEDFYKKNNVTYSGLASYSGDSSQTAVSSSDLYEQLYTLMSKNHGYKTSYDGTRQLYQYTDCEANNTSKLSLFYCGATVSSTWNGNTFNREHTWPNSLSNSDSNRTTTRD